MPKKVYYPLKGMNDKDTVIPDDVMDEIVNCENRFVGKLSKRMEQMQFDSDLTSAVGNIFDTLIDMPKEPFYPTRKPSDMSGDYILPIYGIDGSKDYVLWLFYENSQGGYEKEQVDTDSTFNEDSELVFKYIQDLLIVLDYAGDNPPVYITVDEDNNIIYDQLKNIVAKPDRMIYYDTEETPSGVFTSNESAGFSEPKLFRWFYTIVNVFGDEGNPSPGSPFIDLCFKKIDTDLAQQQWVASVTLKGLSLPTGASARMKEDASKYRLYRQEIDYSDGRVYTDPTYVKEFDILNKDGETTVSDTVVLDSSSPLISFTNTPAPIAKDAELAGSSIILTHIKSTIDVIGDFDAICPINISNLNAETFPNGRMMIRLKQSDFENEAIIPNLYYLKNNLNEVRILDSDYTTPIPAVIGSTDLTLMAQEIENPSFADGGSGWGTVGDDWYWSPGSNNMAYTPGLWGNGDPAVGNQLKQTETLTDNEHSVLIVHDGWLDGSAKVVTGTEEADIDDSVPIPNYPLVIFSTKLGSCGNNADAIIEFTQEGPPVKIYYFCAEVWEPNNCIDLWLNVPALLAGQQRQLYLAFCLESSEATGVANLPHWQYDDSNYENGEYGEFLDYDTAAEWAGQKVFDYAGNRRGSKVAVSIDSEGNAINKANGLAPINLSDASIGDINTNLQYHPTLGEDFGFLQKSIQMDAAGGYAEFYTDDKVQGLPNKMTMSCYITFDSNNLPTADVDIMGLYKDSNEYIKFYLQETEPTLRYFQFSIAVNDGSSEHIYTYGDAFKSKFDTGEYTLFCAFSYNIIVGEFSAYVADVSRFPRMVIRTATDSDLKEALEKIQGKSFTVRYGAITDDTVDEAEFMELSCEENYAIDDTNKEQMMAAMANKSNYCPLTKTGIVGHNLYLYRDTYYVDITNTDTITITGTDITDEIEGADQVFISQYRLVLGIETFDNDGTMCEITNIELDSGNTVITVAETLTNDTHSYYLHFLRVNDNVTIDAANVIPLASTEHKNKAVFTNANGRAFPAYNIKLADTPILRQARFPTTLAEMKNSVVWFYRNGFTRFIANGLPSEWVDATDVDIKQFKQMGLAAEKSLCVTEKGIVWFSEIGILLLAGTEPIRLSKGLDIPIKSTYTHWYCSYTHQYGLHDNNFIEKTGSATFTNAFSTIGLTGIGNTGIVIGDYICVTGTSNNDGYYTVTAVAEDVLTVSGTVTDETVTTTIAVSKDWVINLEDKTQKVFRSLDMKAYTLLTGGSDVENIMLMINNQDDIDKYPDYENGSYTRALCKVKKTVIKHFADFVGVLAKYTITSGNASLDAEVVDPFKDSNLTLSDETIKNYRNKKFPPSFTGNELVLTLKDMDTIEYFIVDINDMKNQF